MQPSPVNKAYSVLPRRRVPVFLTAVLSIFLLLPGFGKSNPIDLEEYARTVDQLRILADSAKDRAGLKDLIGQMDRLPEVLEIDVPASNPEQTETQKVSTGWIQNWFWVRIENTDLAVSPEYFEVDDSLLLADQLGDALAAHLGEIQAWGQFEVNSDENIKAILDESIYEDEPEEDLDNGAEARGFIRRLNAFLKENMVWIIVGILLIVLAWLGIKANQGLDMQAGVRVVRVNKGEGLLREDDPTTFKELKEKAEEYQQKSDLNEALRYHYLSFILLLHERHIIYYSSSLTNWEYQNLMVKQGIPYSPSYTITNLFDLSHYGQELVNPAMMADFRKELNSCINDIPTNTEAKA